MIAAIIVVFIIGYLVIVFEHPLQLDKTVPALIMGALMWALAAIAFYSGNIDVINSHGHVFTTNGLTDLQAIESSHEGFSEVLLHHLGKTAEILIFLIGAMTIVELIDLHRGFEVLKDWVKTKNKKKLLWIVGILGFILSAIIDNLTATIVLVSLLRKLITDRNERIWYVSLIVIAANAGGAWSPIGDVTTTMLWIGKKVSAVGLIEYIILPSIACFVVPFLIGSMNKAFKGDIDTNLERDMQASKLLSSKTMLYLGLGMIIFVPVFKSITHLPPYLGMMLSLGVVWLVSEYIHPEEDFTAEIKHKYSPHKALSRIELSSILFFLGILMAVAAIETIVIGGVGALQNAAQHLEKTIPSQNVVIMLLGVGSAIIDNVPLVAAAMGMYTDPIDDPLWHFLAYAAGTGGSMLIIGSAAGVAAMGMERIDFIWYLKKITLLAAIGYLVGCAVFILMHAF
ncbi:MAG: sodium:proton antiporter NhaD [Saprospiraceae bacterium]|nr:sodium:proton antiporter NhaD [Saprospiraceae bacterium]